MRPADDLMLDAGERSPKTLRLAESPRQQHMLQVTSTDLDLYEHEDAAVHFKFDNHDLDKLEQYEFEFYDDELLATDGSDSSDSTELSKMIGQLTFPFSSKAKEPELSDAELTKLDALADRVELDRLEKLAALQEPNTVPEDSRVLSTRFVRTWREKHDSKGNPIWLRRSRFVAREFAWLSVRAFSLLQVETSCQGSFQPSFLR